MPKDPILRGLTLQRFRSVVSERIEFSNPTFLIGPNASGKSNIVNGIKFLSEAISGDLQQVVHNWGGSDHIKHRMPSETLAVAVDLGECGPEVKAAHYSFLVRWLDNWAFIIDREQCVVETTTDRKWFDRTSRGVDHNLGLTFPSCSSSFLCLNSASGVHPLMGSVVRTLTSALVYDIRPEAIRAARKLDSGRRLMPDGSNLASVVKQIRADPTRERALREGLKTMMPNFRGLQTSSGRENVELYFHQDFEGEVLAFEAKRISDGTLRMVGLLAAVLQDERPSVLIVEEPEASIHPALALGMIQDTILDACDDMQVIVTTHSTDLLDAKWIKEENLRMVSWDRGATRVTKVSERTRQILKEQLEYPGGALRSNTLHAPEPLPAPNESPIFQDVA